MTVGENIKSLRKERKLTQKRVGEICGIDEANIRKYESGKQNPKLETLKKIASALGVGLNSFLDGNWDEYADEIKEAWGTSKSEPLLVKQLTQYYDKLNPTGKQEAVKRISELAQLPKYTEKDK